MSDFPTFAAGDDVLSTHPADKVQPVGCIQGDIDEFTYRVGFTIEETVGPRYSSVIRHFSWLRRWPPDEPDTVLAFLDL